MLRVFVLFINGRAYITSIIDISQVCGVLFANRLHNVGQVGLSVLRVASHAWKHRLTRSILRNLSKRIHLLFYWLVLLLRIYLMLLLVVVQPVVGATLFQMALHVARRIRQIRLAHFIFLQLDLVVMVVLMNWDGMLLLLVMIRVLLLLLLLRLLKRTVAAPLSLPRILTT